MNKEQLAGKLANKLLYNYTFSANYLDQRFLTTAISTLNIVFILDKYHSEGEESQIYNQLLELPKEELERIWFEVT